MIFRPSTSTWPWRTSWRAWAREAAKPEAVDDVVEPPLEHHQQVLAGDALAAVGLLEVEAELALEHAVDALDLLLLAQLQAVAQRRGGRAACRAGRAG